MQDKGGVERLRWHVDKYNCQKNDYLLSPWKRFFSARLGMHVTGVVTACWKQSINSSYIRRDTIGRVSEQIASKYLNYPGADIKEAVQGTLSREGPYPNHFDPLVHLSSCIDNINRTDDIVSGLQDALLVDIALGSILYTNNITRFDIFYKSVLEDVRITGVLPIGESEDLMGLYVEWLRENYSSFDGNAGRK
jgi:hypothetical protein